LILNKYLVVSESTLEKLKNSRGSQLYSAVMDAAIELGLTDRPIDCGQNGHEEYCRVWKNCLHILDSDYPGWRGYLVVLKSGKIV
jgi:hypothetical protein